MGAVCAASMSAAASNIIPAPTTEKAVEGVFCFAKTENVAIPTYAGDSVAALFRTLKPELQAGAGAVLKASNSGRIALKVNPALPAEGYSLRVTADSIVVAAARPAGFFHALESLKQLLPVASKTPAHIDGVEIYDEPRFPWRGFMLDESRHFFGKESVKRVIDMMALYKMNRFHWHLTDDQGWRVEIKKYPKLTTVGARRGSMHLGWGNNQTADSCAYGPYFYTTDDIRDVVEYAKARFIEVIPEIDMPGHMQAAVAAYPQLACNPKDSHEVWDQAGVSTDVLNVAKPETVEFAAAVIEELAPLFPFGYLHLGGDECPTDMWKKTPECAKQLAKIGSDNYQDLQYDFYNRVTRKLADKGITPRLIFWNEVLHGNTSLIGKNNDDITIMSWVNPEKDGIEAASRGMQTIMTPIIPYYINRRQSKDPAEPQGAGSGTETLSAVYAYEPLTNVPEAIANRYHGVQANFWTEWVEGESQLQYLMLPRLAAVAERAWSPRTTRDYDSFATRLDSWHSPYYRSRAWNHGRMR